MVRTTLRVGHTLIVSVVLAASATAQTPPAPARMNPTDLKNQIYVMEGALARAVQFGALRVNREMRSFSPEMFSLAGDAQARGVYLEGYGVHFDVGVPILRQSMLWSFRTIVEQNERSTRQTIETLREVLGSVRDQARRRNIELTISQLEMQLTPDPTQGLTTPGLQPSRAGGVGAAMVLPGAAAAAPPPPAVPVEESATPQPQTSRASGRVALQDPNRAYTEAVQRALIDAMINYSVPMLLRPDEWLTVSARDNEPRDSLAPQDPFEEVVTVILRIKGEDLAAYRSGKIDLEETKKRVQIREF